MRLLDFYDLQNAVKKLKKRVDRLFTIVGEGGGGGGSSEPQNLQVDDGGQGEPLWYTDGDTLFIKTINGAVTEEDNSITIEGVGSSSYYTTVEDFPRTGVTTPQSVFPNGINIITLEGDSTYEFEGLLMFGHGNTSHSLSLSWDAVGLTVHSFLYTALSWTTGVNTATTGQTSLHINTMSSTAVVGAGANSNQTVQIKGRVRTNAAGTIEPLFTFSADPGGSPVTRTGSYIKFQKLGNANFGILI